MRFLEKFMDALVSNPIIKNSKILYEFLTIEEETDFMNKKKEYLKVKSPTKLSEMKSLDGEIKSILTKENEQASEGIKNYVNLNEMLMKKLCTSHKNLFLEMNQVSIRMKEISEIYNQLHYVSEKSSDVSIISPNFKIEYDSYRHLQNAFQTNERLG